MDIALDDLHFEKQRYCSFAVLAKCPFEKPQRTENRRKRYSKCVYIRHGHGEVIGSEIDFLMHQKSKMPSHGDLDCNNASESESYLGRVVTHFARFFTYPQLQL